MSRRIVVTGASGNVGTSVLRELAADSSVGSVVGIARPPDESHDKITWKVADVARTGVPALVHASLVGAYSPGPKDRLLTENWPTHGWPAASYTREKSYRERVLGTYQRDHPDVRVVRMRPAFLFKRESASEQRRLFAGPLIPGARSASCRWCPTCQTSPTRRSRSSRPRAASHPGGRTRRGHRRARGWHHRHRPLRLATLLAGRRLSHGWREEPVERPHALVRQDFAL
jgi:hypothetical protein